MVSALEGFHCTFEEVERFDEVDKGISSANVHGVHGDVQDERYLISFYFASLACNHNCVMCKCSKNRQRLMQLH